MYSFMDSRWLQNDVTAFWATSSLARARLTVLSLASACW